MLQGRRKELDRIEAVLAGARGGAGGSLAIVGEPGIGKTALLAAAVARAEDMQVVAATGVESEAKLPFAALTVFAEPLLAWLPQIPPAQAEALEVALALRSGGPAAADRLAILAGFTELLRKAAADQPVLLVVDDAQWVDRSSAECLAYAARRIESAPLAMLVTWRADEPPSPLAEHVGETIDLQGLDHDESLELLGRGARPLAEATRERLVELAAGNPLALVELPKLLSDEQATGAAPLDSPPAPVGALGDAFDRRLGQVGDAARGTLAVAAMSFDSELAPIVAAADDLGLDPTSLEEAETHGLVVLSPTTLDFSHPLLRAALHDAATPADRRRAHRALAGHTTGDARAWHLASAALGADAEAAGALAAAAARASARGAHSAAADALTRAAELAGEPAAAQAHSLAAGLSAALGGDFRRSAALLEPLTRDGLPGIVPHARHLLAMISLTGGLGTAVGDHRILTDEAGRISEDSPELAATIYADAGVCAVVAGNCPLVLESAEAAAAILPDDAGDVARCQVQSILGMGLALTGHTDAARGALDSAGELLEQVDPLSAAAQSIALALGARASTGQLERLFTEASGMAQAARDAGSRGLLPYDELLTADAAYRLGRWDQADARARSAVTIAEESGQLGPLSIALAVHARLLAARGDLEAARTAARRGVALAEEPGYGATFVWARAALGFLELGAGRIRDAIAELELTQFLAAAAGLEDPLIVPWEPDLIEAYVRAGRIDEAMGVRERFTQRAKRSDVPLALAIAHRCRDLTAPSPRAEEFEATLALHEAAGAPFETARTRLVWGSGLHRDGRRVAARRELREAAAVFKRLGATPWMERAQAELRAAGARQREPVADPDELTAQEARVARAVARGATNREVAEAMFLSPKTIEFHLSRAYRKLGIRSRTELASLVAEGRLDSSP